MIFVVKTIKPVCDKVVFINIDESHFGREVRPNYSWIMPGFISDVMTHAARGN